MKKLVTWMLVLALATSAVGCTKSNEEVAEPTKTEAKVETTDKKAEETKEETKEEAKPEVKEETGSSLIEPAELNDMLKEENVVVVDLRGKILPGGYVPGSVYMSEDEFAEVRDGVKGMRPSKENFEKLMASKGIKNDSTVVLYDDNKMMTAARVWWIMKVYGHEDVRILHGAAPAWKAAGFETASSPADPVESTYTAKDENPDIIATLDLVKTTYDDDKKMVIDTRSEKEWNAGHIPGAVWIEWKNALAEDGTFKSVEDLTALYEGKGFTKDLEVIIPHCKSAWRSAHTMFVLQELLGYDNVKNYDGSWLEFSASGEEIAK